MAEVEEPQFTSLADRIAALNKAQIAQNPTRPPLGKKAPPPIPSARPTLESRSKTTNIPPTASNDTGTLSATLPPPYSRQIPPKLPARNAPPPLPTRRVSSQSPALPPRRPSQQPERRGSTDSTASYASSMSTLSISQSIASTNTAASVGSTSRKLPPVFDQSTLPPLPPTRREVEAKAKLEKEALEKERLAEKPPLLPTRSLPILPATKTLPAVRPALPPRLPSRLNSEGISNPIQLPQRKLPPPVFEAPSLPIRPVMEVEPETPPVPRHSRPSQAEVEAIRKLPTPVVEEIEHCLLCRDFSGPDHVATLYPRESLPPNAIPYLANVLCSPFQSPTDKARAIFTWMHYNIEYDVTGFFNKCIQSPDTEITLRRGLAVCSGYSALYRDIALHAGLEVVEVVGHGKGYGYSALRPGDPVPREDATGHAWNAVRIDNGEWKLIDACWGAGALGSDNLYHRGFTSRMFTITNEEFGLTHFPARRDQFFRSDGSIMTWNQYIRGTIIGEPLQFPGKVAEEGFAQSSFSPAQKEISVHSSEDVRFQFSRVCEHWQAEKHGKGKPYVYLLKTNGKDGESGDWLLLEHNEFWWWIDVPANELGRPGQTLPIYSVETINDEDARGVTKDFYLSKKGRSKMSFSTLVVWQLV